MFSTASSLTSSLKEGVVRS